MEVEDTSQEFGSQERRFGHAERMDDASWVSFSMTMEVDGTRQERLSTEYCLDCVKQDMKSLDVSPEDAWLRYKGTTS